AIPIGIHRWVKYKLSLRVRGYEPQDRSLTGVAGRCLGHGCQATAQRAEHPRTRHRVAHVLLTPEPLTTLSGTDPHQPHSWLLIPAVLVIPRHVGGQLPSCLHGFDSRHPLHTSTCGLCSRLDLGEARGILAAWARLGTDRPARMALKACGRGPLGRLKSGVP